MSGETNQMPWDTAQQELTKRWRIAGQWNLAEVARIIRHAAETHAASLTQEVSRLKEEVVKLRFSSERLRADVEKAKSQRDEYIRKSVDLDSKLRAAKDALSAALPLVKARLFDREMKNQPPDQEAEEVLEQINAVLNPVQGAEPSKTLRPKCTQHSGDCTFYASLINRNPTDGICTCGYGWTIFVDSGGVDYSQLYSEERLKTMKSPAERTPNREIARLREVLSKIPCSCGLSEKDIVDGIPHFPDCAVSIAYESLKQQTNP